MSANPWVDGRLRKWYTCGMEKVTTGSPAIGRYGSGNGKKNA